MSSPASGNPKAEVRVWDILVRFLHWSLVAGIAIAWLTEDGPGVLHDGAGYVVLAIVAIRLVWGLAGPRSARFVRFLRSRPATLAYARAILSGAEPRYLGHNPLGGRMIAALLLTAAGAGVSGWLYTTDAFWGLSWMEAIHEAFANLLLLLIAAHIAGVAFTSWRQKENLVRAMVSGRKESRPRDIEP